MEAVLWLVERAYFFTHPLDTTECCCWQNQNVIRTWNVLVHTKVCKWIQQCCCWQDQDAIRTRECCAVNQSEVEGNAQIFHNCLHSLVKHWSKKFFKRNLVINLDYSFKIKANPVKPTVNQTFPMAQCVPECVPDVLDVD